MGYAHTNMIIYGVKLKIDKAKLFVFEIAKLMKNDDNEVAADEWKELQDAIKISDIDLVVSVVCEYDLWFSRFPIDGIGKYKDRCDMWGHDADSRCHCTEGYNEDIYDYSVGVQCGDNGYAANTDILIKNEPTSDCLDSYKPFSAILTAIGVLDAPTLHLIGQTH